MHSAIAVAQRRGADSRGAVPEAGGRGGAASALRHVLVNLKVRIWRLIIETLDRTVNEPGVEFLNVLPGETHPVHGTGAEVFHQYVGLSNQLFQNLFAFGRLGVQG